MPATLSDFPIGTTFCYKGVFVTVIEHRPENDIWPAGFKAHYVDKDGRIRALHFTDLSFDYLLSVVNSQRGQPLGELELG
jgi:hypothetical protein